MQPARTLTIKNLPAIVHRRLVARAAQHERSLNSEVIACLKAAVMAERLDPEALLIRARALRREVRGRLSDARLRRAKQQGRA
jgi:plasmid stability protein